jgi:Zn-dependent peptidase ImmA (M78 family)
MTAAMAKAPPSLSNKDVADRARFDASHELAHLLLHCRAQGAMGRVYCNAASTRSRPRLHQ